MFICSENWHVRAATFIWMSALVAQKILWREKVLLVNRFCGNANKLKLKQNMMPLFLSDTRIWSSAPLSSDTSLWHFLCICISLFLCISFATCFPSDVPLLCVSMPTEGLVCLHCDQSLSSVIFKPSARTGFIFILHSFLHDFHLNIYINSNRKSINEYNYISRD